jgi:FkbM family methyltransferase
MPRFPVRNRRFLTVKAVVHRAVKVIAQSRGGIADWGYRIASAYCRYRLAIDAYNFEENGERWLVCELQRLGELQYVIDVGANCGEWTAIVLDVQPNARVHLFEAAPSIANGLRARFGNYPNIVVNAIALSNRAGAAQLLYYPDQSDVSTLTDGPQLWASDSQKIDVELMRGDDYSASANVRTIDLLKVDCEGHDYCSLEGFGGCLDACKVIQFEHNLAGQRAGVVMDDFVHLLANFRIGRLIPRGVDFAGFGSDPFVRSLPGNFVAVRKDLVNIQSALQTAR